MGQKLLLMSRFDQESFRLKEILATHLKHEVQWVRTADQALMALKHLAFDVIIINTEIFVPKKLDLVRSLRALGYVAPVIFLADKIDDTARIPIPADQKALVLEKPAHADALQGVLNRALNNDNFSFRFHKRFVANEEAKVSLPSGEKISVGLGNLSMSGAFLNTAVSVLEGTIIKVTIYLNEIDKQHEFKAKVIWNHRDPVTQTPTGLGVRFVKSGVVQDAHPSQHISN